METLDLRGSSKNRNSILLSLWISCSSSLSIPKFSSYSSSAVALCLAILANISQTLDGLTEIVLNVTYYGIQESTCGPQ